MKLLKLYSYVVILALGVTAAACTSNTTSTDKQHEVSAMDSVSKDLEKTNKELQDEAEKVEASLEKIDKEFNTSN